MIKPWLSDGANEFLEEYINKDSVVLEFGMGNSSIWFANRVKKLVSIEHDREWFLKIQYALRNCNNVELILHETSVVSKHSDLTESCYSVEIDKFTDETFDLVLVDGRNRVNCFKAADRVLKKGGIMMLDNSERGEYEEVYDFYKNKQYFEYSQCSDGKTSWWIK